MSHSGIRLACDLAGVGGVSLRPMALLFTARFLMPRTKSSINRWMDDMGSNGPTPEAMLRQWLALAPAPACPMAGYSPLSTDPGVMGLQDAPNRLRLTHAAASEHGDDARQCLQRGPALGLQVTAAFSDYSPRFPEASTAVEPQARCQADPFHMGTHIWGHRKQALLS
jgi:hypothetical protein